VLKSIIHDWDGEVSTRILTNCRNALEEHGRVPVCEMLITPGPESIPARTFDIEMLLGPSGRERTEAEFAEMNFRPWRRGLGRGARCWFFRPRALGDRADAART